MKIAKIIPQKKLPRSMQSFDYIIPAELQGQLKVGSIVDIPFKKSTLQGVVVGFADKSEFKFVRPVSGLNSRVVQLPLHQVELMNWFSKNYYYSLGSTLKLFMPGIPKRSSSAEYNPFPASRVLDLKADFSGLKFTENKFLLFSHEQEKKFALFKHLIRQTLQSNKQIMILFPQLTKLREFLSVLDEQDKEKTAVLISELHTKKNVHFQTWKDVLENKKQIILGTRSAVFAPLHSPGFIIIDDAHSEDYKQWDQNPRYNVIEIAREIQRKSDCKLILSSLTPRLEDAYIAKQEKYKIINLGNKQSQNIRILDLKKDQKNKFTYLSAPLYHEIDKHVKENKKIVLVVNKKGLYGYLFCDDCGFEALCPHCNLPLIIKSEKELYCHRCNHSVEMFLRCPKCRGTNLKKFGIGDEQIRQVLEQKYPNEKHLIEVTTGQDVKTKKVDFLGFVYIDSLVYLADFNSNFRIYSFVNELVQNLSPSTIIVQTNFPDNLAFQSLGKPYKNFYSEEMESRKILSYPPFSTVIKLFFQHHDEKVCKKEAQDLFSKLKLKITQNNGKIIEPYLYYARKVRKRFRYQIVLFLPLLNLDKENEILAKIPEHWAIDKNPINLL